jgi:glycosyltransferase involved in cell wall biosynthesis
MKQITVCHISSVHSSRDNRVFFKECRSLAKAGFKTILIAKNSKQEDVDGVTIIPFVTSRNRFLRVLFAPFQMFSIARKQRAQIYHFHDPELLITGILLRLFTRGKVIYDIHEDYKTSIRQKYYLSRQLAYVMSILFAIFENISSRLFAQVLAERYYAQRFPRGTCILNYPIHNGLAGSSDSLSPEVTNRLLYTGVMSWDRGSRIHAEMLTYLKEIEIHMVGLCRKQVNEEMREIAGADSNRLYVEGEDQYITPERIREYYQRGGWLAGLAIFPPTSHYRLKELTKFFEYMAAGVPIICSNFPMWQALIDKTGAGIAVDPFNHEAITAAINYLKDHPVEAAEMSSKGKQAAEKEFNWGVEETKLIAFYNALLKEKK